MFINISKKNQCLFYFCDLLEFIYSQLMYYLYYFQKCEPTFEDCSNLPYMDKFLKETMRIHPFGPWCVLYFTYISTTNFFSSCIDLFLS